MNNFWSLVGFEFKKIFSRKSVIISLALAFFITVLSSFAMVMGSNSESDYSSETMSNYEAMQMDKSYEKELEGRPLDGELILEASRAYQKIDIEKNVRYTKSEEYQNYARKYSSVYGLIDAAYAQAGKAFNVDDFQNLSEEDAHNYYTYRENQYRMNLMNNPLWSPSDVLKVMELDKEVKKPFIMAYKDGYQRFFGLSITTTAVLLLVISFCLSPVFSSEYAKRTDALILSAKNGRSTVTCAKITAALLLSFCATLLFHLSCYFACMGSYGFDGTNAQIQLLIPAVTYNFTMLDTVILIVAASMFGAFLHTAVCLFVSSLSKNSIIPMTVTVILIAIGMFNGINNNLFITLRHFLPSAMGSFWDITTQYVFHIFGMDIMLYQAACMAAFAAGSLLFLFAYRNFRNHQAA